MAGQLNLDNYEIGVDESTDELVITHAPTGKTTTLSEDTFEAVTTEELLLTEYASADDATAGSGVGIVGVTSDGHLLLEDGK